MSYCPYSNMTNNYYRACQTNSYVRVFHASPNAPAVDVYANGNLIINNLAYKQFSQYLPVPPGNYNIRVYPSGEMTNPVLDTNLYIPQNTIFNAAVIGMLPDISLYPIPEPITAQTSGFACARFIHLSPNAPAVDIKLSDGTIVFSSVGYRDITNYACVPPGTYSFIVSLPGTDNVVLTIPNIRLDANSYYTIYAVGVAGGNPPLEALPVVEPRV